MKKITLYTDGGCKNNPGVGGWGCILKYKESIKEISGASEQTTNNRMELTAVIEGLKQIKEPCQIDIVSDSTYICQGIIEWLPQWRARNWINSRKQAVLNVDLWQAMDKLIADHQISCHWVKGHSGHPENERADAIANFAIAKLRQDYAK